MILLENMTREQKLTYYQGQIELMNSIARASLSIATVGIISQGKGTDLFVKLVEFCTEITIQTTESYKELQEND